jgi:UDP-N-acetylglucosamine diphosphorylase/glucosamine-1-phosphate N-acetyltransferase
LPDLFLFDDALARTWEPFALTRPVGELMLGTMTMRERTERVLGLRCRAHVTSTHLADFDEDGAPTALAAGDVELSTDTVAILSRFVAEWGQPLPRFDRGEGSIGDERGNVIGWFSPAGIGRPEEVFSFAPSERQPRYIVRGRLLDRPWDLISANPEQIAADIEALFPSAPPAQLPEGVFHWGEHLLVIDPSATVEPGCALDTSAGPIWLDRGSRVRAFTRLAGPAYIGADSALLGGPVEAVSVGPVCRIRGELAESVCLGYVNKQHDGHIGHAYLGRWVNLGAETTNSDLKNNYGTIRMWTPSGVVDTGMMKMGSLLGDHVKTGIGLLLNTGTVVGAGSNLFGSVMPPTYVPPFSWGTGNDLVEFRADKFLEVAERAMGRRRVALSDRGRLVLERAWRLARAHEGNANMQPGEP